MLFYGNPWNKSFYFYKLPQSNDGLTGVGVVRFSDALALGSESGVQYPYRRVFFLSTPLAQKNVNQIWAMGCLLDSSTSQLSSCPITSFFYSLVTALALDFFPPPDCNFWQRQVFHLDFSFSDLSPAAILYFLSHSCANSRSNKHQLDRQYLQFEKDHLAYGWELCTIEIRRHLRLC